MPTPELSLGLVAAAVEEAYAPQRREWVRWLLMPLFASDEERARVNALVDGATDDLLKEMWSRYCEAEARRCPECGRPYEEDDG